MGSQALPFGFGNSRFPGPAPSLRATAPLGQEVCKKRVQHSTSRVLLPDPLRELGPARPVGGFDMPALHEWALVEQWDTVPLIGKLIEFLQESIPGRLVRVGVDRVDRKNVAVVRAGQDGARVLADKVRAERHVAAKIVLSEMLFSEREILAQRAQPLIAWEGPEGERVLRRRLSSTVVDRLVRIVERGAAGQAQRRQEQLAAGEPRTMRCIPEGSGR